MTSGQTMLALGALVLLITIMLNFYRTFSHSWDTIDSTQLGIDATTIATSIMEIAHGLAFDEATDSMFVTHVSQLTPPDLLGREGMHDDSLHKFNDFDDFHGYETKIDAGDNGTFKARFEVSYVDPHSLDEVQYRTFAKRLDMWIWRYEPPHPPGFENDTLYMYTIMGYFRFQ